jgi:hypothetical protein
MIDLLQFVICEYFFFTVLYSGAIVVLLHCINNAFRFLAFFCICENLAPFLKPEAKTPNLVSSDFGFGLEIKLVACLK